MSQRVFVRNLGGTPIVLDVAEAGDIGAGTITGPGSSTDNAVARWNGATGTAVQNSTAILDDNGDLTLTGTAPNFVVGAATGNPSMTVNAAASGSGNGGFYQIDNGGLLITAWGTLSGIFSGTYDATTALVSTTGLKLLTGAGGGATPLVSAGLLTISSSGTLGSVLMGGTPREVLTANRTYYVRTDGSDSNTGLADNSGGAFLTIQKAINVTAALDISIYDVTIQVRSGTYAQALTVTSPWLGTGAVTLTGDTTTPGNVIISSSSGSALTVTVNARLQVAGFKFSTTGGGNDGIKANFGSYVRLTGKCEFATASAYAISAENDGNFASESIDHIISSNCSGIMTANGRSTIVYSGGTTTLTGTPAFAGAAAVATDNSVITAFGTTFSGAATGVRFNVNSGAVINTFGSGGTYFPGGTAGVGTNYSVTPWGLYL